jgi:DNA-directed RNA polymerase subunit RPC12/RpoP
MYMEKKNYHCIDCGKKITEDEYIEYGGSCKECHTFGINH